MSFRPVIDWAWQAAPPAQARLLLLDSLGCAWSGLRHPTVARFAAALAGTMPGDVALAGARLAPAAAAAVLASAMCWDEANDGLARAHGRPGLSAAPLALVALQAGATMRSALAGYALGYEVSARAGEAWRLPPGLHVDGSWHSLGAAAAAVLLAGGTPAEAAAAVALAACQVPMSLYAPIAAGLDGRNSYPAHAVLLGQMAAAAARAGMTAPADAFETGRAILLPGPAPAMAPAGLWLMQEGYIKPWPGVRHAHYGAHAAMALHRDLGGPPRAPVAIRLTTYAEALRYAGNRAPVSPIAAQFSLSWAVAVGLARGRLTVADFAGEALADPGLRALEAMVELTRGDDAPRHAVLDIDCAQGRFSRRGEAIGGEAMDAAAVRAKFLALADDEGTAAIADHLLHKDGSIAVLPPG